jgi:hypothetical protein
VFAMVKGMFAGESPQGAAYHVTARGRLHR